MAMDYTNFYTVYYWMSKLKTKKVVKGGIKMEPLAGVAKDLYALIFRFSHGKNGCCNMSYKTMEDVTGVPKSTLIRNLKLLEESNLIQIEVLSQAIEEKSEGERGNVAGKQYRVNAEILEELIEEYPEIKIDQLTQLRHNELKPTGWNDYSKEGDFKPQEYFRKHHKQYPFNKIVKCNAQ